MRVRFYPSRMRGTVTAPPSKSCAHRALICAMLSEGESIVRNVSRSGDIDATLSCIEALGRPFEFTGDTVHFPPASSWMKGGCLLPCRESGSTMRFMLPIAMLQGGGILTGTDRLISRGIELYEKLWDRQGIAFEKGRQSVAVSGHISPGLFDLRGDVSSQYISGLLFALPTLGGDSIVRVLPPVESAAYIDLTVEMLSRFGLNIDKFGKHEYFIPGRQNYSGADISVEGDWSNAAFLLAADSLCGDVSVTGLDSGSIQPDSACSELYERVVHGNAEIDVSGCPDLAPILMALGSGSGKGVTLTGTHRLRLKESDRGAAMAEELWEMGLETRIDGNTVAVLPGAIHPPSSSLDGHNDHRIVMALSILLTLTGGEIDGAEAVDKSWPEFFTVLRQLGARLEIE